MTTFDEDLFLKGLEQRKATLGADYVEKNLAAADDFTRPFQEAMTAWCWGFGWGDEVIPAKTRSMMNLSMIGALGKMQWMLLKPLVAFSQPSVRVNLLPLKEHVSWGL